jgi:hypothetical protein
MPRSRRLAPGNVEEDLAVTIDVFRRPRGMSKATFYRLPQKVRDELITYYGPKTARIYKPPYIELAHIWKLWQ